MVFALVDPETSRIHTGFSTTRLSVCHRLPVAVVAPHPPILFHPLTTTGCEVVRRRIEGLLRANGGYVHADNRNPGETKRITDHTSAVDLWTTYASDYLEGYVAPSGMLDSVIIIRSEDLTHKPEAVIDALPRWGLPRNREVFAPLDQPLGFTKHLVRLLSVETRLQIWKGSASMCLAHQCIFVDHAPDSRM